MATSATSDSEDEVVAMNAEVLPRTLRIGLSDGRTIEVSLATPWLRWLLDATVEERTNWVVEPGGFAIYWPDLDDGVEIRHLLSLSPIS